jgi:hypothetical protein
MTNVNARENMSRKKYLVPVVVLLLCLVSLAGAAYAYTSSVTTHGTATANAFYVELYDADDESDTIPVPIANADVVTFSTDMDYDAGTVVVKATPDNKDVATVYLKVNSTVPGQTNAKIKFASDIVEFESPLLCDGMTLEASVSKVMQDDEITVNDDGTYTVKVNETVVMTIFLTVGGDLQWNSTTTTYPKAEDAINAFHDDFEDNAKFKFKITAENIEP